MPRINDYGRGALDFIEGLERLRTVDSVMDAMERAFNRFGFETIILTGVPNPEQRLEQVVLAKRWPAEWFKIYTANEYVRVDPAVRHLRRTVNPFEWSEAPYDAAKEPRAAEVMRRAVEFGMAHGFAVPIHNLTGYEACVSLGGKHLDLNVRSKAVIHLMGMYSFDRVRRIIVPPIKAHRLTSPRAGGDRVVVARQVGLGDRRNPPHQPANRRGPCRQRAPEARRHQRHSRGGNRDPRAADRALRPTP